MDQRREVKLNLEATINKNRQRDLAIVLLVVLSIGNLWSLGGRAMSFALKTTAFPEHETIPQKYTCDGADISPGLTWGDAPVGTKSLALIADDPDVPAGTWTDSAG